MKTPSGSLHKFIRRFARERDGVAAIEFGIIAPVVFLLFVGAVEMSQVFTVDRRAMAVATATADLVARTNATITQTQMSDIMKVGSYVMLPYPATALETTVRNVTSSPSNAATTKQSWYCTYNANAGGGNTCACNVASYTLPTGLVSSNDSVVVAEVRYFYTPLLFDTVLKRTLTKSGGYYTISKKSYAKPRSQAAILQDGSGAACASPTFP